jgi:predicted ATP-dependent endonuclease of OLD family
MKELLKHADELIQKVHRLLDRNDKLVADLLEKEEKIRDLNLQLKEKSERVKQLEEGVVALKLSETVQPADGNSKEVKKKINEYLRELDRCIAKLSAEGYVVPLNIILYGVSFSPIFMVRERGTLNQKL